MQFLDVESIEDEDLRFKLRLEVYLLRSALKIKQLSEDGERFDSYISKRIEEIKKIAGDKIVRENGIIIYPPENLSDKNL
ncbi:hypothetical protein [Caldiplasma sukawensis]